VATRIRIAAAACLVVSGLFVSGVGAAVALADPEAAQSDDTGDAPADPTGVDTPPPPSEEPTATATAPKPTSQVGDGRGGSPRDGVETTRTPEASSKQSTPSATPSSQSAATPTTTPGSTLPLDESQPPGDADDPEEHPGWQWWPWCWPTPRGPGLPPGTGTGSGTGGGGGGGVPRSPALPVVPADPTVDVVTGLATAAAQLPLVPLALPAIVAPLGAGAGGGSGVGGPGVAPGPSAPRSSGGVPGAAPPPRAREQNRPAFSAGNGTMPATYRAGYGQYLRTAGLGEMAAVAVPGVTGILVLTLAGGVLGFRQARSGHAVRANGTARFIG
jgi:hypothetical protein